MDKKAQAAELRRKAKVFWTLLLDSPTMLSLESAIRVEKPFDKLTRDEIVTIGVFLTRYERAANGTKTKAPDGQGGAQAGEIPPQTEAVEPDEIIPPKA